MSTKKSESKRAKSKNLARNQPSPKDSSHEKVWAERDQLRVVVQKNEEIEKLTAAILSAREHLCKAIDCLQKIPTAASASTPTIGQHTDSPKTPKQEAKPAKRLGPKGVLKRSASNVADSEHSESQGLLKRSKSAPEKTTSQDH